MRNFVFLMLLLLYSRITINAQDSFIGLFSDSYYETQMNGGLKKIQKPFYIIYNRNYCQLSENGILRSFPTEAFAQTVRNGHRDEGFLNAETSTFNRGWYSIHVLFDGNGTGTITVNMPVIARGKAFIVPNAEIYSEDGKVKGKVYIKNWKELTRGFKYDDSLAKAKVRTTDKGNLIKKNNDSITSRNEINGGKSTYIPVFILRGLKDLRIVSYPEIKNDFNESNTVIVDVSVDSSGSVTKAKFQIRGSTTSESVYVNYAVNIAREVKFSKSQIANTSEGSLAFRFKSK
jgi:hypothetical protein